MRKSKKYQVLNTKLTNAIKKYNYYPRPYSLRAVAHLLIIFNNFSNF